jgi:hypothetical protein
MARCMGRRLFSAMLPLALAACGDDVSEAVTSASTETGDDDDDDDDDDGDGD